MEKKTKKIIYAVCTLAGTIIGVGLFSLPYITSKVGFWIILLYFLILGGVVLIVHLLFSKIAIETPDFLRFPGYAKHYFGKKGKNIASTLIIFGFLGSILAYLIVGGEFLTSLLMPTLGGNTILYTFIYFVIGSLVIYFGIKAIAKVEFWGLILFFVILGIMFLRGQPFLRIENIFPAPQLSYLFFPYGAILFSLWGAGLIPEIEEMLGKEKKLLKKVVPIAIIIPIIVYIFFIFLVLGITGARTTTSAITGLQNILGDGVVKVALFFGILTTFTSYITLGLTLQKVLWYDLKVNKKLAFVVTAFTPFIFYLIGFKNFIDVISFVGGIILSIEGILIILMYQKLKKESKRVKILALPLILLFVLGIIYQIIYFIK